MFATTAMVASAPPLRAGVPTYQIPRTDLAITVDGRLDEPAWEKALLLELDVETNPGDNIPAPVRTVCRLIYSTSHLYYGCTAYDPHPEQIRARLTDRDQAQEDDTVGLAVDTFNSNNRAYVLDINPLGVQNDRLFTEADQKSDPTWDTVWQSAGRITEDGFEVEAAIPFSSLRFQRTDSPQIWGFNLRRYYPRDSVHRFALTPQPRGERCRLCNGALLVGFEGIDPGHNLEVTPTVTGIRRSVREDPPHGDLESESPDVDPGLSVRWSMTPNLTLNGTLNPDFSQVEADEAQLDVNQRFALFFEERRPFFLEGADFFATSLQAVYTRTIADPSWGTKLSGKVGRHTLGAFVARDDVTNLLLPGVEGSSLESLERGADVAVVRYRRDLGSASTLGVLYTGREAGDYSNRVAGFDAYLHLDRSNTLTLQALGSRTRYPGDLVSSFDLPDGSFDDHALYGAYHHQKSNWTADVLYQDLGQGFRADLGFVPRVGYRQLHTEGEYHWFGDDDHWFTRFQLGGAWNRQESQTGDLLSRETRVGANYSGPMQSILSLTLSQGEEVFRGISFDNDAVSWFAFIKPSGVLQLGFGGVTGDGIDFAGARPGTRLGLSESVSYTPGRHLRLSLAHQYGDLDIDGGKLFVANQLELRAVYQITARAFVRAIVQNTRVHRDPALYANPIDERGEDLFGQLLFAYKLDPQTAVYVGYTGAYRDFVGDGLVETGNSLFLKLSYNWQP